MEGESKSVIRFFTLPPIPYEYIIINANNPQVGLSYIRKYRDTIKNVIIDSGIEIFRNPKIFDYPPNHIYRIVYLHNHICRLLPHAEVLATIPDYCDDYNPKSLWKSEKESNIERTIQNIIKYTKQFEYVNWLIPIQGWNKNPKSIIRAIEQLKDIGTLDNYEYFGIGNLCIESNTQIIYETAKLARKLLPKKKLHFFGLKLRAIPFVFSYINSFDSLAWTRPINKSLMAKWSCKTKEERIRYFVAWLKRLNTLLKQKSLIEVP